MAAAFLTALLFISICSILLTYAVVAFFLSRIFKKAGVAGWKAWVPVYSLWITYEIGGQPGWWAIILLLPVVSIVAVVFLYIAMYDIGLKLGKSGTFVLWAIFLPLVWYIWLALDPSRWNPVAGAVSHVAAAPADTSATTSLPPAASL